ncbi:MAG: toxin, partial [Betaproteobacteria bacterium]
LRSGLLAGERLHQEVKRLEVTYLERNVREHEMTKNVSLRRLDPKALVALRLDRACEFELPEWLFDLDAPGHYARRLKSVSLSVPCVVGPYGVVNCKLILLGSRTRVSAENVQNTTSYLATTSDARFEVRYGAAESIVTSSGRDDSGLFETSLRDERFLPFEGAGAISRWRLELPGSVPQFDFDTISDVILHLRYTARDGGESMRDSAKGQFGATSTAPPIAAPRPMVLVSAKEEFSTEWSTARDGAANLIVHLGSNLLPYWMLKAGLRFVELATLDVDGSASRAPITKWRRSGSPPIPPGFSLTANDTLRADLGRVATNVDDRLIFLTMGP